MSTPRRQSKSQLPAPVQRKGATLNDITEDADREMLDPENEPAPRRMSARAKRERETGDLRALLADVVHEYTYLRRRDQIRRGYLPEDAQEVIDEYDPVVQMALMGARTDLPLDLRLAANAQVAKFVRPTLKSVETHTTREAEQEAAERKSKAESIFDQLHEIARQRRLKHDARVRETGVVLDQPEPINITPTKEAST